MGAPFEHEGLSPMVWLYDRISIVEKDRDLRLGSARLMVPVAVPVLVLVSE